MTGALTLSFSSLLPRSLYFFYSTLLPLLLPLLPSYLSFPSSLSHLLPLPLILPSLTKSRFLPKVEDGGLARSGVAEEADSNEGDDRVGGGYWWQGIGKVR